MLKVPICRYSGLACYPVTQGAEIDLHVVVVVGGPYNLAEHMLVVRPIDRNRNFHRLYSVKEHLGR